jgi:hypothetical protein
MSVIIADAAGAALGSHGVSQLSDADSVRLYPELIHLIGLRDVGWLFLPVNTIDGQPIELDGFRAWPGGYVDGLRIYSATNAMGIRTAPTEPPTLTWERTDTLSVVVAELLALPAPDDRLAPTLAVATAPKLWTP